MAASFMARNVGFAADARSRCLIAGGCEGTSARFSRGSMPTRNLRLRLLGARTAPSHKSAADRLAAANAGAVLALEGNTMTIGVQIDPDVWRAGFHAGDASHAMTPCSVGLHPASYFSGWIERNGELWRLKSANAGMQRTGRTRVAPVCRPPGYCTDAPGALI